MAEYEPRIIQKFADRLYRRAKIATVVSTIAGVLFGCMNGLGLTLSAVGFSLEEGGRDATTILVPALIGALGGAAILGLVFFLLGRNQAFRLKVEAQKTLCQLKIEENTQ
jgi:hypothetical protein